MYRADTTMPVTARREGGHTTTIKANVSDQCAGLLSIVTKDAEGWWAPIVGGETVAIFAMCQMTANDFDLAQDFPFVVDGGRDCDKPPTLVESARDLAKVAQTYGQDLDELLAHLADFAAGVLAA